MPPLFEELQKNLDGECVADAATLNHASTDSSPFSVRPQVVIYPKSLHDIKACIFFAKKYGIPLTVRGLGKGSRGACLTDGFVLDMSRYFDKMDHLVVVHSTITIQAGMSYHECKARLASWGYVLPFVETMSEDMTIGGMFSDGYRGGPSLLHGGITDWVESLRVVLDDGNEYHISPTVPPTGRLLEIYKELLEYLKKEASVFRARRPHVADHTMGYDVFTSHISPKLLIHLLAGSQGTLGIITEITFRLAPKELQTHGIAVRVTTLHDLPMLRTQLLKTSPAAVYGFGTSALLYSQKLKHNLTLSRHEKDPFTLFAVYENRKQSTIVATHAEEAYKKLAIPASEKFLIEAAALSSYENVLHIQKEAISSYAANTLTPVSIIDDIVVPEDHYVHSIRELSSLCEESGLIYSITGDVGNNCMSVVPLIDLSKPESADLILELLSRAGHIVKQYHGSLSYKLGDGLTNTPLLSFIYGEQIAQRFLAIKTLWDPYNIFNAGKKTTIDFSYLKKHIKHVPYNH